MPYATSPCVRMPACMHAMFMPSCNLGLPSTPGSAHGVSQPGLLHALQARSMYGASGSLLVSHALADAPELP